MSHLLFAFVIVVWFASLLWLIGKSLPIDESRHVVVWRLVLVAFMTVSLAGIFAATDAAASRGPCIRYDTGFASTGKTIAPYRYCVERGEWIQ